MTLLHNVVCLTACAACFVGGSAADAEISVDGSIASTCSQRAHVKKPIDAAYIVEHQHEYCNASLRAFAGKTLVYVTPWNGRGYDVAKTFKAKFDYISPTWLQIRDAADAPDSGADLTGKHDVDRGWMTALRVDCASGGACPAIVPRVVWESRRADARVTAAARDLILAAVREYDFDGIVLEAAGAAAALDPFVTSLADALHALPSTRHAQRTLTLVLPPSVSESGSRSGGITPARFAALAKSVDHFSLMTYDFSAHSEAAYGPNAPLPWTRSVVLGLLGARSDALSPSQRALAARILTGIPFYGYDDRDAVTAPRLIELLQAGPAIKFNKDAGEHYFNYVPPGGKTRTVYFTTPYSVHARASLASKLGTGVSVWEIGQGMDFYLDAL